MTSLVMAASGVRDHSVVNKEASCLVLSLVADKVGSRNGLSTITDKQIDFAVNSLNAIVPASSPRRAAVDKLASSIIACEVPEEIQFVEVDKYREIRDTFTDLREPFHKTTLALGDLYRLGEISDQRVLDQRIKDITAEFDQEVQKLKKSNFGRQVRKWVPVGVASLATLVGGAFQVPEVVITSAAVTATIQVIQTITGAGVDPEEVTMQRLIGRMQKKVVEAGNVKRLV